MTTFHSLPQMGCSLADAHSLSTCTQQIKGYHALKLNFSKKKKMFLSTVTVASLFFFLCFHEALDVKAELALTTVVCSEMLQESCRPPSYAI